MSQLTTKSTFSLTLNSLQEVKEYADILAKTAMVPKNYQNKSGDILVAIQMGAELGLKPIQSLQNIAVINGKPSVYGDTLIALVQTNPVCESIKESFDDKTMTAICTVKRKGEEAHAVTFSQQDAQKAGLWNRSGPWTQYPKRMLQMRARGFALRDKFADVLGGLITVEEARDYPVDVTPQTSVEKQDLSSKLDNVLLEQNQTHDEISQNQLKHVEGSQEEASNICLNLAELVVKHDVPLEIVNKWCEKAQVKKVDDLPEDIMINCVNYVQEKYPLPEEIGYYTTS